jgi:hypothetical protein
VKARKVKGVDPDGPAAEEVARIVAVRLDELLSFMPKARDPQAVHTLHDLRIAAKRLRYVLELFGSEFGPYAGEAAKQVKKLQDVVGEIHDCDVTRPRIAGLARELADEDARAVRALAGPDAKDLDPALAGQAPHRAGYRGLVTMDVALAARRDLLFDRFLDRWEKLERDGFRERLLEAITSRSHGGNGEPAGDAVPSEATST